MLVLLHLFALFLLVLLGFYVFVENPRNRAHQTFAIFIAFLALWTVKDLVFWNFPNETLPGDVWAASSFVIALLMQCALVVFAWVFPENARTPRKRAAIIFAPGIVLVPAALLGLLWKRVDFRDGVFAIDLAPLAYAFVVYVYFLFVFGAVVLFGKYRRYRGTQRGQQVGAILWALVVTGLLKTFANIVAPFFGHYAMLPYSAIFVLPGVLIYAYAISNFRLFSLENALDQFRLFPIAYKIAFAIASVAIISFTVFQVPIVYWAFKGADFDAWRKFLVFSVLSALVPNLLLLLLVVRTISRPLQRITLAALQVTDGQYGTEVDLRHSNDEIGLLADSFNEMSRKMAGDITRLRELNEQLTRTEKLAAMGTLAAGVAHEVNNPLASISSLIQMMESRDDLDARTKENLRIIQGQIARITQVTRDMMDFARVRPAAKSSVDVNELIEKSIRLASFDKSFRELDVIRSLAPELPPVFADGDQLQQVFLNLLLNARDAMPGGGGRISVRTSVDGRDVMIRIADSGSGISGDDAPKIFDPFFTTKPAGKGTGLGLAVCYGIVTAHGGRIELADDDAAAGGTTFVITLPAGSEPRS